MSTKNTAFSQIYINILRANSVISDSTSFLDLNYDVLHDASGNRYSQGNDISLVNLGLIDLFSSYMLTTNSGKHSKDIRHAHIVSSIY